MLDTAAHLVDRELPPPAVIYLELHRRLSPRAAIGAVVDGRGQLLMAVRDDVGLDDDDLADRALGRKAAGVDFGRHVLDYNSSPALTHKSSLGNGDDLRRRTTNCRR